MDAPLRLALPKGRPQPGVLALLAAAGLRLTFRDERDYRPGTGEPGLVAKLVKARAVPQLVALGRFDLGFAGRDLVEDAAYPEVVPLVDTGQARVELVIAAPRADILERPPRRPLLIATEYEGLADRWALGRGLAHITLQSWGSTEAYPPEDADLVLDCVETGRTLQANGLVVLERLLVSTLHLVAARRALDDPARRPAIERLAERVARAASAGEGRPAAAPADPGTRGGGTA